MPADISILDDAVKGLKGLLAGVVEDTDPTFQLVLEKGDVIDLTQLPICVVHTGEESVNARTTTTKIFCECPVLIETVFARPQGAGALVPAERHRQLLALLQSSIAANTTLGVDGVTDILYAGLGSQLYPEDTQDAPYKFGFIGEWTLHYRYKRTDPTVSGG